MNNQKGAALAQASNTLYVYGDPPSPIQPPQLRSNTLSVRQSSARFGEPRKLLVAQRAAAQRLTCYAEW
jgi:hypothetical protein